MILDVKHGLTLALDPVLSGTVYYQLPADAAGSFVRGGVIFLAMLFNALNACESSWTDSY